MTGKLPNLRRPSSADFLQRRSGRVTASGRELRTLATRTLRRYECGLCGQRLDRLRKSPDSCGAIYPESREACSWNAYLTEVDDA